MAGLASMLYSRSPVWLQNLGITLYGAAWRQRRLGGAFRSELEGFLARDRWSRDQFHDYQTTQLRATLQRAFADVPAYQQQWSAAGIKAGDLASFTIDQLPLLPLTDKEDLRARPDAFIAQRPSRRLHTTYTSGSTGTPLAVRLTSTTHQRWIAAYEARCRRWAGVDHRMSRAMIGGRLVVPHAVSAPPYWRHNRAERQLYLSAYHISPLTVGDYVGALNAFRPDYLIGYASAHFFLARLIDEAGLRVHSPRAVLTSSEKLTPEMRTTLQHVYRCDVFDAYSGVEPCCLASECEAHTLHVSPDVGIVELLDDHGAPANEGEVVATGFINPDQPLIRYRMRDVARWERASCACGRQMPALAELVGRIEDAVIGPDGRETVRFHGVFIGIPGVIEGQVIQETLTTFTLRVVAPEGLSETGEAAMKAKMRERLGDVQVTVEIAAAIERAANGKFRAVISHVARERS